MKKLIKIIGTIAPIATTTGVSATVLISKTKNKSEEDNSSNAFNQIDDTRDNIYNKINVFPDIQQQKYYKYLKMKNGHAYIDDEMISQIVKGVLKESSFSGGQTSWSYKFFNNEKTHAKITFEWIGNIMAIRPVSKTYDINIAVDTKGSSQNNNV